MRIIDALTANAASEMGSRFSSRPSEFEPDVEGAWEISERGIATVLIRI